MNWEKLLSAKRIRRSDAPKDGRNEFESDYGRIIFSPAIRRMHDKTQVFPLTTDDNIHSRLTHSVEVMSLGYTFGLKFSKSEIMRKRTGMSEFELLRTVPILLQNICLIHDIGNAPFGHFGETIISEFFTKLKKDGHKFFTHLNDHQKRDFTNYDGNAQGLRVLTKLQYLDNPFGLNLTYATLASFLKYPNFDEINSKVEGNLRNDGKLMSNKFIENSKHGVFYSEKNYFQRIATECGLVKNGRNLRHPLCYLMEAADTIAYRCMDMEDGFNTGLFTIENIKKHFDKHESKFAKEVVKICGDEVLDDNTKIVRIRVKLIAYFVELAYKKFEENIDKIEAGEYRSELVKDDPIMKIVRDISNEIFKSREINYLESTGHSVMTGLLKIYIEFVFDRSPKYQEKAATLISKSVIESSIEENLLEISEAKLSSEIHQLKQEIENFKDQPKEIDLLKNKLREAESNRTNYEELKEKYLPLFEKQFENVLSTDEVAALQEKKNEIKKIIKPEFKDLDDYSKFRVILDFISGMTDQYALNHFQKLSGQKIN